MDRFVQENEPVQGAWINSVAREVLIIAHQKQAKRAIFWGTVYYFRVPILAFLFALVAYWALLSIDLVEYRSEIEWLVANASEIYFWASTGLGIVLIGAGIYVLRSHAIPACLYAGIAIAAGLGFGLEVFYVVGVTSTLFFFLDLLDS